MKQNVIMGSVLVIILSISEQLQMKRLLVLTVVGLRHQGHSGTDPLCPKVIPQNLDNFMKWGVGMGMNDVRKMMEDGRKSLKNLEINKIMLIFAS